VDELASIAIWARAVFRKPLAILSLVVPMDIGLLLQLVSAMSERAR
jgi:hypothetical protein